MQTAVYFGRGILAALAIMLPPVQLNHFHAAIGACRGSVVFKQCTQSLFKNFCIIFSKTGFFGKLAVDAAIGCIKAKIKAVLHANSVRRKLAVFGGFAVDGLCDLDTADVDGVYAECRMKRNRAAYTDGNTIALVGRVLFESKNLTKAANIQPFTAGGLCIRIFVFCCGF